MCSTAEEQIRAQVGSSIKRRLCLLSATTNQAGYGRIKDITKGTTLRNGPMRDS